MLARNYRKLTTVFTILALLLLCTGDASAYVGPGAGLDLVAGFTVPLLAYVFAAFSAIFVWPAYALLQRVCGFVKAGQGNAKPGLSTGVAASSTPVCAGGAK